MLTVFNIYSIFSKLFKVPCEIHQHPDMKRYCSFFNVCTHQLFHHTSQHPQFHTMDNYIDITLLSCDQLFFNLSGTCLSMDSIKLQFKALKQSRVVRSFQLCHPSYPLSTWSMSGSSSISWKWEKSLSKI